MYSPELQAKIEEWRRRAALPVGDPDALQLADVREYVALLRQGRIGAAVASQKARGKKAAQAVEVDGDDLLKGL